MPNIVKKLINQELEAAFEGVDGLLLVSFGGLTVAETEDLRNELAAKGVGFRLVQNRLARRVLIEKGYEFPKSALRGNTGIAYGSAEAAIAAAKVFTDPAVKKAGKVAIKGGMLEQNVLDAKDALQLADIPDGDALRAMILGCISGPARSLVGVLNGLPSGLARVIQAHSDQGEEEGV